MNRSGPDHIHRTRRVCCSACWHRPRGTAAHTVPRSTLVDEAAIRYYSTASHTLQGIIHCLHTPRDIKCCIHTLQGITYCLPTPQGISVSTLSRHCILHSHSAVSVYQRSSPTPISSRPSFSGRCHIPLTISSYPHSRLTSVH